MILTDELCDKLCAAAREKSRELGLDISFAVCDQHGLPRVYRRYGEALTLSVTLVPGKAYTAAVTQCRTEEVAACAAEGGSLMAIQSNDPRITLVAGGYPLFAGGKIAGGVGVGGTRDQDCAIAEYVVSVFQALTGQRATEISRSSHLPQRNRTGRASWRAPSFHSPYPRWLSIQASSSWVKGRS